MKASQLDKFLSFCIIHKQNVLIKGSPGIGKTSIVESACKKAGAGLITTYPVVSDPTDYKGLPFAANDGKSAHFLPFSELDQLIKADRPTVYFLDDIGQATPAVQSALMGLLLSRRINGFQVSDHVTFIAATNRREDMAGVSGVLEPVKSRFASIVQLDVDADDWITWAIENNMPTELIAFIRFSPDILSAFKPTRDIVNTPSPRTVAHVGRLQNLGLSVADDYFTEAVAGAAGEAFASQYKGFLDTRAELPTVEEVLLNPDGARLPESPSAKYAIAEMLASRMTEATADPLICYLGRLNPEFAALSFKSAFTREQARRNKGETLKSFSETTAYINWAVKFHDVMLS
jgi:hypothetical protein